MRPHPEPHQGSKPGDAHGQLIIGLTTNLAQAVKPTSISAHLGPFRRSCSRGHMPAIPGSLPDLKHFGHEAMTVKNTYPGGDERRGHARPREAKFMSIPLARLARQWAPLAPCISYISDIISRMSRCKLSPGRNDRRRMKPSRKDHLASSQGLSENSGGIAED